MASTRQVMQGHLDSGDCVTHMAGMGVPTDVSTPQTCVSFDGSLYDVEGEYQWAVVRSGAARRAVAYADLIVLGPTQEATTHIFVPDESTSDLEVSEFHSDWWREEKRDISGYRLTHCLTEVIRIAEQDDTRPISDADALGASASAVGWLMLEGRLSIEEDTLTHVACMGQRGALDTIMRVADQELEHPDFRVRLEGFDDQSGVTVIVAELLAGLHGHDALDAERRIRRMVRCDLGPDAALHFAVIVR